MDLAQHHRRSDSLRRRRPAACLLAVEPTRSGAGQFSGNAMGASQDKSADSSDPLRHRVIDDDGTVYADWTWAFKVRAYSVWGAGWGMMAC